MTTENPNYPSDRTGDGPLPLLSYDILLQDMGLDQILTTTVAEALVQEARDTPWSEVWKDFPTAADNGMSATNYRGGLADSPAKKYSMVIRGGRLEILYGWSGCRPLAVAGSRQAGLIGDRRYRGNQEISPKMATVDGVIALQDAAFENVTLRPKTFAAIEAELAADGNLSLVAPADGTVEDALPEVTIRKSLKVHPKIAALFMRGVPIKDAVGMIAKLYHALPNDQSEGLMPLLTFIRAAVTAAAADPTASVLGANWVTQPTAEPEALENWYLDLLSASAPKPSVAPNPFAAADSPTSAAIDRLGATMADFKIRDKPKVREYTQAERKLIAQLSGYKGPVEGTTDDILPEFWQRWKSESGKGRNARMYVEQAIKAGFGEDEIEYGFLVTNQW